MCTKILQIIAVNQNISRCKTLSKMLKILETNFWYCLKIAKDCILRQIHDT